MVFFKKCFVLKVYIIFKSLALRKYFVFWEISLLFNDWKNFLFFFLVFLNVYRILKKLVLFNLVMFRFIIFVLILLNSLLVFCFFFVNDYINFVIG